MTDDQNVNGECLLLIRILITTFADRVPLTDCAHFSRLERKELAYHLQIKHHGVLMRMLAANTESSFTTRLTKFVKAAYFLSLIWSSVAQAALNCSETHLQNRTSVHAVELFLGEDSVRAAQNSKVSQSKEFLDYLRNQRPLTDTALELRPYLISYLQQAFDGYRGERLDSRQRASLQRSLIKHGWTQESNDPRQTLRDLSRRNVEKLLNGNQYFPEKRMEAAEQLVSQIELSFIHNGTFRHKKPLTPVLSSRQLSAIGAGNGLNSRNDFNSKFLESDDNVFFSVYFRSSLLKETAQISQYGNEALVIDPSYANEVGWVSAYMMYGHDLVRAGRKLNNPDLNARISKLPKVGPEEYIGFNILNESPLLADDIRKQLFRFDFTINDFQTLIRSQLLIRLQYLLENDPEKFKNYLVLLKSGEPATLDAVIKELVFDPLSLPTEFELKIPVAIPPQYVRVLSN